MVDGSVLGSGQPDPLPHEHDLWRRAAEATNGITPFEAKALYAAGLLRHLLEASGRCLATPSMDLPAFVLAAEAAEGLGRCLIGDRSEGAGSGKRLRTGLREAMVPSSAITTSHGTYDVPTCVALRNFTTHGGTTPQSSDVLDRELINEILRGLANALDRYWADLGQPFDVRTQLATALLRPLSTSGKVVFLSDMKSHIGAGGTPGKGLMYDRAWR